MNIEEAASSFLERLKPHLGAAEAERVRQAWILAEASHRGQLRASGEAYISHPLAVAEILFETVPDADAVCAALLHDVVEDCGVSLDELSERFGPAVARIVDAVSKFDAASQQTALSVAEETLKKLLAAGGRDRRVFALKLADRLHNVRTLDAVRREKQQRVARETLAIYCPLASHVGLNALGDELFIRSRRYVHPWREPILERRALVKQAVDSERIRRASMLAAQAGVQVDHASDFRILAHYVRLHARQRSLFGVPMQFFDLGSVQAAYATLAQLHAEAVLVPGSFRAELRDGWIACRMHYPERGLTADFTLRFPIPIAATRNQSWWDGGWTDEIAAAASAASEPGAITRSLREIVDLRSIWTFSPAGQGFKLPAGSRALDFAFAVHTDVGLRATSAVVNGAACDLSQVLKTGDVVEIKTAATVVAQATWLPLLQSPRARAKLRHWLKQEAHAQTVARGRSLLAARLLPLRQGCELHDDDLDRLARWLGVASPEEVLFAIGSGSTSATLAAAHLTGQTPTGASLEMMQAESALVADGSAASGLSYCTHCQPIPPDDILALISDTGFTVHRSHCQHALEGARHNRLLPIEWAPSLKASLPTRVRIEADDRIGLLADCASTIAAEKLNIDAVTSRTAYVRERGLAELDFTIRVKSIRGVERCCAALARVGGVRRAYRIEETSP